MSSISLTPCSGETGVEIFTPYITKNGKRIYHPQGKLYHFFVKEKKSKATEPPKDSKIN